MNASREAQSPAFEERDLLFQQFARVGGAMSSPQRLRMLSLLSHRERTVEELAGLTGQSLASASAHLKVLRGACLVSSEKRGRHVHVRLAGEEVLRFWLVFREFGAGLLPEAREVVQCYFDDRESMAPLTPRELAKELKKGRVTLLDLRPSDEFEAGHLPGAVNFPFAELASRSKELCQISSEASIYAYCRGPYCVMAWKGVQKLRAMGIPALRLAFSVPEWRGERLKVIASRSSPAKESRGVQDEA
jgi:DNA-binding transcriptional ArsR family regulator/rhodanese-related sulfurtransferase